MRSKRKDFCYQNREHNNGFEYLNNKLPETRNYDMNEAQRKRVPSRE
jgi:hypothetical protein